jgi:putative toxin-antitoxin system antitoxin component (TIGR02293 family)
MAVRSRGAALAAAETIEETQGGRQRRRRGQARAIDVAGITFADVPKLIGMLSRGLNWSQFDRFRKESGFTQSQLAEFLGIPERTLARRRENGALTESESERFARLVEIFNACMELFDGNSEAVREWLTVPAYGLNNARPIDFTRSDYGAREVRNLIGRLADGVFS